MLKLMDVKTNSHFNFGRSRLRVPASSPWRRQWRDRWSNLTGCLFTCVIKSLIWVFKSNNVMKEKDLANTFCTKVYLILNDGVKVMLARLYIKHKHCVLRASWNIIQSFDCWLKSILLAVESNGGGDFKLPQRVALWKQQASKYDNINKTRLLSWQFHLFSKYISEIQKIFLATEKVSKYWESVVTW